MIDNLLSRLRGLKQPVANVDQWVACCPAHEDRNPSLAIKQDGDKVLIHCFAGCPTGDVLAAVGLAFRDIMPEAPDRSEQSYTRNGPRYVPKVMLEAIAHDALAVAIIAQDISEDGTVSTAQRDSLWERAKAIQEALDYGTR